MKPRAWIKREKYVVIHGQSFRFRVVKYLIIAIAVAVLFSWNGWTAVGWFFAVTVVLGTTVHFIFRWKTKGWTQSWGPYKKMKLPQ